MDAGREGAQQATRSLLCLIHLKALPMMASQKAVRRCGGRWVGWQIRGHGSVFLPFRFILKHKDAKKRFDTIEKKNTVFFGLGQVGGVSVVVLLVDAFVDVLILCLDGGFSCQWGGICRQMISVWFCFDQSGHTCFVTLDKTRLKHVLYSRPRQ